MLDSILKKDVRQCTEKDVGQCTVKGCSTVYWKIDAVRCTEKRMLYSVLKRVLYSVLKKDVVQFTVKLMLYYCTVK